MPLVELRAEFTLSRRELEDADRGARDLDLSALDEAAAVLARAENRAVFHGYADAGIHGLVEVGTHDSISLESDPNRYPAEIARAVDVLREAGIGGPYGLAIAPEIYTAIVESTEHGGYPLFEHLHQILEGPVVWAPGIDCGVVLSQRGDDFVFDSGQDIAIGYREPRRRGRHPVPGRELHLPGARTRRRRRARPAAGLSSPHPRRPVIRVKFWHH